MKRSLCTAAAALLGVNISYAGEGPLESLISSVSPAALSGTVLPEVPGPLGGRIKRNSGLNEHGGQAYEQGGYPRCGQARALEFLALLENPAPEKELPELARLVCRFSAEPAQTVRYPGGAIAYAGPEYSDKGSWKYPGGRYALVGEGWSDKGSWKYPNGQYAFVGEGWSDKGSWKYPGGKYAFVGEGWSDKGSWKYPDGQYAYVGEGYSDRGSWKYPGGKYAFVGEGWSDTGSWKYPDGKYAFAVQGGGNGGAWYYPNGNFFASGDQGGDLDVLTRLVEDAYNVQFPCHIGLRGALEGVNIMHRLHWIERTMLPARN